LILDSEKLTYDNAYREDMRFRFLSDGFFAADMLGFKDFNERAHGPVFNKLYFPKNPKIPIREQHPKHKRLHLDPRHTFKTTAKRIDRVQWICAFPEELTVLVESATQPLAQASAHKTALVFYRPKNTPPRLFHLLFPELVTDRWPEVPWNVRGRRALGAGDLDSTLAFTSPKSTQSGWHPLLIEPDDVEDTLNSGIDASADVRTGVINSCDQNENCLRDGGYINICGTRYHPFDWYGKCIDRARENPDNWEILIRCSLTVKDGSPLVLGEFPEEDAVELHFPEFMNLSYGELREKFHANFESFMCFCAGARVLMADWTEKSIEELKVGDEIMGFQKFGPFDTRLLKATVERTFSRRAEAVKVTTDSGRVTCTTPDHRFLRPSNGGDLHYVPLKIGSKMVSVYQPKLPPTPEEQRDWDWLGGIIDGEGSVGSTTGATIYQKAGINPEVFDAIRDTLKRLQLPWRETSVHSCSRFLIFGGRSFKIHLLQYARFAKRRKLLNALWDGVQLTEASGRRGGSSHPAVVSIESLGEQIVYDIQSSTSNFVCDGFAVHNCQQQNSPRGGNVARFDERLFDLAQIQPGRIPRNGDTYICWRPRYGGNKSMAKFSEGAAARISDDGRIYVLDAWQGTYTPSAEAEKIVAQLRAHDAAGLMMIEVPGSEYLETHIRNEALKRNRSLKLQWLEWNEDQARRTAQMEQLEPLLKTGRLQFSTGMGKAFECRSQFVHFGLTEHNGIIQAIAQFADLVPISLMRANMSEAELEYGRKRRDDALLAQFLSQQGMDYQDQLQRQKTEAHLAAMGRTATFNLPPLPGGLDG
jgi:hypothetical protein